MEINNKVRLCSSYYKKWKNLALASKSLEESKKCLERAFFWLELQTAFVTLFAIEKLKGNDPNIKFKIVSAKANLCKKLAEYAKEILDELNL